MSFEKLNKTSEEDELLLQILSYGMRDFERISIILKTIREVSMQSSDEKNQDFLENLVKEEFISRSWKLEGLSSTLMEIKFKDKKPAVTLPELNKVGSMIPLPIDFGSIKTLSPDFWSEIDKTVLFLTLLAWGSVYYFIIRFLF